MVAFTVILYRQFPVAGDVQQEPTVRAAVVQRFVEFRPSLQQVAVYVLKRRRGARDVDPNHVKPDMTADFDQPERIAINAFGGVLTRSTDMRSGDELALGRIAPAVIGAANGAFDLAGLFDKDHATMSAGVLIHADLARAIPQQKQRHPKECQRNCISGFGNVCCNSQPSPFIHQNGLVFRHV